MLHRSTLLSGAALAAVMFLLVACDTNDQPPAPEDRTITQSPDPQQPQDTRGDTGDQTTGADGIDVEREPAPDTPQSPETRQPQEDPADGIEVEPER